MAGQIGQAGIFEYEGRWYEIAITITHPEIKGKSLDLQHIVSFEYVNSLNSLFLTGELIFVDTNGEMGKYLNLLYTHVQATITQKKKVGSGNNSTFVDEDRGKWGTFHHEFLIDNVQILSREKSEILYRLYLVSNQWYLFCSRFVFSNYDKAPGSQERKIFNIIAQGLTDAKASFDKAQFENRSKIELPYITNGNDTIMSSIKYLLNMSYYSLSRMEEYLKFIILDPFEKSPFGLIKCLDFGDPSTYPENQKAHIIVSLFETSFETFFNNTENNFSMVIKKPATKMYESFFKRNLWQLNMEEMGFKNEVEPTGTLVDLANKVEEIKAAAKGTDKYSDFNQKWFPLLDKYYFNSSTWDYNYSIYDDMLENLINRDSIIINTAGEQSHQPGTGLDIELDRSVLKNKDVTGEHKKDIIQAHRQLESLWIITKARHIYRPTPESFYRENLVLSRNFSVPREAEVLPAADF